MRRTLVAFLVAPAAAAFVFGPLAGAASAIVFSYLFSYVLGVPVFLLLRKLKKESHVCYVAAGFTLGMLYILAPNVFDWRKFGRDIFFTALAFGGVGAAVAISFSLLRGNERKVLPDR